MNEEYRKIEGYDNYEVSKKGNVRNIKTGRILKPRVGNHGYLYVVLSKNSVMKTYRIHKLIALSFIENQDNKPFIDHKDNNKLNNEINNLRWVSVSENNINRQKQKTVHQILKELIFINNQKNGGYKYK